MPLIEITAEESRAGLAALGNDLACLLTDFAVAVEVRAVLGHVGLISVADLANYETEEQRFREAVTKDIGLATDNPKARISMGRLVEAWKSGRNRLKVQDDEAAIARAQGRPAPLPETTFSSMRRGWQTLHGDRGDHVFPSRYYVNRRLRQLETGELRAEKLIEVVTVLEGGDEEDDREVDLIVTATALRAQRKNVTVNMPSNPEQLRHRVDLMQVHWDLVLARHSDRRLFLAYDRGVWDRYVKHLLGEEVYQYRARGQGLQWNDLLEYDYRIRSKAIEWVNKGEKSLTEAINDAMKDPDIKQLHFTLPLITSGKRDSAAVQLSPNTESDGRLQQEIKKLRQEVAALKSKPQQAAASSHEGGSPPPPKGGKKGKGKGGKGKGSAVEAFKAIKAKEKLLTNLPNNGGRICYFYNIGHCSNGNACNFQHACVRCGKHGHPVGDCRQAPNPK